jgi:hypothetical protein
LEAADVAALLASLAYRHPNWADMLAHGGQNAIEVAKRSRAGSRAMHDARPVYWVAYWVYGLLKCRADPAVAQDLEDQGFLLIQEIGDEAGAANCIRTRGAVGLLVGDPEQGRREIDESLVGAQACGDALGTAWSYDLLGIAAFVLRDIEERAGNEFCRGGRFCSGRRASAADQRA